MIPDRANQVWEGLNSDREVTLFLFLFRPREYRFDREATWNDWLVLDLLEGTTCELRMWRDSPLEDPGQGMPKWRRVL